MTSTIHPRPPAPTPPLPLHRPRLREIVSCAPPGSADRPSAIGRTQFRKGGAFRASTGGAIYGESREWLERAIRLRSAGCAVLFEAGRVGGGRRAGRKVELREDVRHVPLDGV